MIIEKYPVKGGVADTDSYRNYNSVSKFPSICTREEIVLK